EINNIKRLILNDLTLFKLPNQFENFKECEELDLSNNEFKEFPQVLYSLANLKILYFNANEFDTISSEIIKMDSLETLHIQDYDCLININSNLFRLQNLRELNLAFDYLLFENDDFFAYSVYSDNQIYTENESNDPTNFVSYTFLKKLIISNNSLDMFPKNFTNFFNLEELDISNNFFEEIPYEIHSFTNLEILNISFNNIANIIIKNGMFTKLLKLYLQCNRITELSISDNTLQSLKTLDLSCNNLPKLDKNIFQLKRLKKLIVVGVIFTEIEKFPYIKHDPISLILTIKNINVLSNIFCYNGNI
ncbi:Leucine rich repeat protein, partial [Spraguea lophii 42_110]